MTLDRNHERGEVTVAEDAPANQTVEHPRRRRQTRAGIAATDLPDDLLDPRPPNARPPRRIQRGKIRRVASNPPLHIALLPNGFHLPSKAEECHHCPLDLDELIRCQSANPGVDVRPSDRRELVDHYVTIVVESRNSPVSAAYANSHQRSTQQRAGHRSYGHRTRGIEEVILDDHCRTRLRRVNTHVVLSQLVHR